MRKLTAKQPAHGVVSDQEEDERTRVLTEFGQASAKLPLDVPAMRQALEQVEKHGGPELMVEALGTMMAFEAITRVVDATCRVDPPLQGYLLAFVENVVVPINKTVETVKSHYASAGVVLVTSVALGLLYSRTFK